MIGGSSKLQAKFKGGGSIIDLAPVFSGNSEFVYVAWKDQIISYNTKTAKRICEFKDAQRQIVGFGCAYEGSVEYIAACTKNGKVIIWKANNALKLRELKLHLSENVKIKYFKIFQEHVDDSKVKALICLENCDTNMFEFNLLKLDSGQLEPQRLKLKVYPENNLPLFIDVSETGNYFVVVRGHYMYCSMFGSKHIRHSIKGRTFTCVACHPEEVAILTGDNTGRTVLWHNIFTKRNATQAVHHWHTLPVETIRFSTSGMYFYSGAAECVLVKWDYSSKIKNFLPRLPAPIKHIAVAENNILIAVATADNGVQLVSPQLKIINTIQQLVLGTDSSAGIIYDPKSKSLVLNGITGHVQLFSPKDMNLIYSLDVVGQNKFTKERDTDIVSTIVTKVAISNSGLWMATVEHRPDPELFECRLKFWFYDTTKQSFSLNTSIEYPHEDQMVDLVFQPTGNEFKLSNLTVGKDKKIKVWQLVKVSTVYYQGYSWRCSGEITYKELNPQVATFSNDGSLIVAGFESIITTWLSNTQKLKCSLRHPQQNDDITHLSFGSGTECHLLLSASSNYISVWNLLTLSLTWTVRIDVAMVIADIRLPFKALFTKDKKLFIVSLKSSKPIYSSAKVLKHVGDVRAAAFIPKSSLSSSTNLAWHKRSCIYLLDSNYELYSVETKGEEPKFDLYVDETNTSLYSHLIPKISTNMSTKANVTHMYEKGNSVDQFRKFLNTPVTALPPLHLICEGILQSMILERKDNTFENSVNTDQIKPQEDETRETDNKNAHNEKRNGEIEFIDIEKKLAKINKESTDWVSDVFKE